MNVSASRRPRAPWTLLPLLLALAGLLGAAPARAGAGVSVTIDQGPPATVVSGQPISPAIVATVVGGVPGENVTASLNLVTGNGGTLSGTTVVQLVEPVGSTSGTATFSNLIVDKAGTFTLTVTSADGTASAPSSQFTVSPSLGIAFAQQPTSTVSQQPITPPVTVTVTSLGSNQAAAGQSVTLNLNQLSGGGLQTLGGTTTQTTVANSDGTATATFNDLSVALVGAYTLTAQVNDNGTNTVYSSPSSRFTITPGAPASLTFTQTVRDAPLGLALNTGTATPGVFVSVVDAAGNAVPGQPVTLLLAGQPGTGTFTGTTTQTTNAAGVASFFDLKVRPLGAYSLLARAGTAQVSSNTFNIVADQTPANVVTNNQDDGSQGTLRTVLGVAAPGATVTFLPSVFDSTAGGSVQTITLLGGEIDVTQSVTLTAPVTSNAVIVDGGSQSGGAASRVFGFTGGPVSFTGVTIQNGQAPNDGAPFFGSGGGIAVGPGASVTLTRCTFQGNANTGAGSGNGGAIYNAGALALADCLVGSFGGMQTGNTAGNDGGGIFNDAGATLTLGTQANPGNSSGLGILFISNAAGNDGGAIANSGAVTMTSDGEFSTFVFNHANNAGGAVANAGTFTMTGAGNSFDGFQGNGARNGGGVYNAGGSVTLTDETLTRNGSSDGGGLYSAGGTLALTGCAVTFNSAVDGGGVYSAGGKATLTSCTFIANRAGVSGGGRGGGLFTAGGTVTLTDDLFYGDTLNGGAVSEIAGRVTATFCDIQQASGVFPGAGNLNAAPQFASSGRGSFGQLVQIADNSPLLGRGTTNAPNFRATDLFGQPYLNPPAIGATEGQEDTHVLWTNPDGRTIFWDTNAQGSHLVAGNYGPLTDPQGNTGYVAKSLSTGSDGVSHILWSTPDGHVALSDVDLYGTRADAFYGPFSDDGTVATTWQPVAVSTGGNGRSHVLWGNPNGRTILWDVNRDASFTVVGNYDGFSDDGTGQTVWKAVALASGPDNSSHILWNNADGHTLVWNLDASADQPADSGNPATASASQNNTSTSSAYGIFSDDGTASTLWHAQAISVGQDKLPRLLWTNPNGRTILWNVNSDGTFTITGNYSTPLDPSGQGGFTAVALATGIDNRSHLAWDNPNGETFLWDLLNDGGNGGSDTVRPFFYGVFSDDGTANTYWKAIAISAAQAVYGR